MENKHELSYETLTRVYLRLYEHFNSVEAGLEPLEHGFELDDQEWVEMGSFLYVRLEMREDLEVLWSIVKARFEKVQPVDDMDCYLLHTLNTMFEHHVEDTIWRNQQGLAKVRNWKLFDTYGVHCVSMHFIICWLRRFLIDKGVASMVTSSPSSGMISKHILSSLDSLPSSTFCFLELGKDTEIPTDTQHTPTIIQPTTFQPQRKQKPRKTKRKDTELPQTSVPTKVVADEAIYEEMHDSVERDATTTNGLDAEQDRGSEPKRQETIGDAAAQTRSERVSKYSSDVPLSKVNTLRSGEDRMKLKELMELYTKLSDRVINLEKTKTAQAKEIANLKKRVKRLERKKNSRSHGLKKLYKRRLEDIDADDNITLVNDQEMFDADKDLQGKKVTEDITTADIEETVSTAAPITTTVTDDELTMAQALIEIKKSKPNGAPTTTTNVTIPTPDITRPKARGVVMQEPNYELAARLQDEEQRELTIKEKSRLFMELMDKRKKHFAKLRAEVKRRKPPTKAQKRN
nr:hypothetical protein [Tanacetum cinerariifolium]